MLQFWDHNNIRADKKKTRTNFVCPGSLGPELKRGAFFSRAPWPSKERKRRESKENDARIIGIGRHERREKRQDLEPPRPLLKAKAQSAVVEEATYYVSA